MGFCQRRRFQLCQDLCITPILVKNENIPLILLVKFCKIHQSGVMLRSHVYSSIMWDRLTVTRPKYQNQHQHTINWASRGSGTVVLRHSNLPHGGSPGFSILSNFRPVQPELWGQMACHWSRLDQCFHRFRWLMPPMYLSGMGQFLNFYRSEQQILRQIFGILTSRELFPTTKGIVPSVQTL